MLSILGTFLTRSGVVSSVHAFAQSSIGTWFLIFLALTFATCTYFFIRNRGELKSENKLESLVSRESSFLFNNLVLLAACFAVLWGTLFPVLSEWVQGTKITVESLRRNFLWPAVAAVAAAVVLIALGMRPWQDMSVFYSLMAISLSVLVTATVASEFIRGGRVIAEKTGQNLLTAMLQLTRRNTRRYGGYIVHFGVVVAIVGIAGAAFNQQNEKPLGVGDRMSIGPYTLVGRSYTQDDNPNYSSESAIVDVYKGNQKIDTMYPERRMFKASGQTATIVANRSTLKEDLYLVYAGRNTEDGPPIIRVHLNPLVMWLWLGVYVIILGTLVALVPNAAAVRLRQPARAHAAATAEAGD